MAELDDLEDLPPPPPLPLPPPPPPSCLDVFHPSHLLLLSLLLKHSLSFHAALPFDSAL